jgi:hypothetical protein
MKWTINTKGNINGTVDGNLNFDPNISIVPSSGNKIGISGNNIGEIYVDNLYINGILIDPNNLVKSINNKTGTVILTTDDISENNKEYFTDARARFSISSNLPINYDYISGIISIQKADSLNDGYISKEDYNNFSIKRIYNEIPSGTIDGNNITFSLINSPINNSQQVYKNGSYNMDYIVSGNNIIFNYPPQSGNTIIVNYEYKN